MLSRKVFFLLKTKNCYITIVMYFGIVTEQGKCYN